MPWTLIFQSDEKFHVSFSTFFHLSSVSLLSFFLFSSLFPTIWVACIFCSVYKYGYYATLIIWFDSDYMDGAGLFHTALKLGIEPWSSSHHPFQAMIATAQFYAPVKSLSLCHSLRPIAFSIHCQYLNSGFIPICSYTTLLSSLGYGSFKNLDFFPCFCPSLQNFP